MALASMACLFLAKGVFIKLLSAVLDTIGTDFFFSVLPQQDWPGEPEFYLAVFADKIYCFAGETDCIERFGL